VTFSLSLLRGKKDEDHQLEDTILEFLTEWQAQMNLHEVEQLISTFDNESKTTEFVKSLMVLIESKK